MSAVSAQDDTIQAPVPPGRGMRPLGSPRSLSLLLALIVMVVAGCGGTVRQPTSYGDVNSKGEGFYGNLMYGCTGVEPDEKGRYVNEKLSSSDYCKCLFEGLKNKVPFDEVRDFEQVQADAKAGTEPEVPKRIAQVREDCSKQHRA